jgi:hypothetical protein
MSVRTQFPDSHILYFSFCNERGEWIKFMFNKKTGEHQITVSSRRNTIIDAEGNCKLDSTPLEQEWISLVNRLAETWQDDNRDPE